MVTEIYSFIIIISNSPLFGPLKWLFGLLGIFNSKRNDRQYQLVIDKCKINSERAAEIEKSIIDIKYAFDVISSKNIFTQLEDLFNGVEFDSHAAYNLCIGKLPEYVEVLLGVVIKPIQQACLKHDLDRSKSRLNNVIYRDGKKNCPQDELDCMASMITIYYRRYIMCRDTEFKYDTIQRNAIFSNSTELIGFLIEIQKLDKIDMMRRVRKIIFELHDWGNVFIKELDDMHVALLESSSTLMKPYL